MKSAQCNPGLAFALNGLAVRSQTSMLAAAGIDAAGPRGMIRAQGLAVYLPRCCAPGSTMTTRASPAPLRRSIARSRADSAGPACSTICAASRRRVSSPLPAAARRRRWTRGHVSLSRYRPAKRPFS